MAFNQRRKLLDAGKVVPLVNTWTPAPGVPSAHDLITQWKARPPDVERPLEILV